MGTWPLSGDFGNVPLSQIEKTLLKSEELGFYEFDTAPNYGLGFMEQCLGKVFGKHDKVKINTKAGNIPFVGKSFEPKDIRKSVEDSLKRLNIESINILYLHNPRTEVSNYQPLAELMTELKTEGKIQFSGVSLAKGYEYPTEVYDLFDCIQDEASLLYLDQLKSAKHIEKTYFRSPLASGLLGGHITNETTFEAEDHRSGWLKGERLKSILKRVDKIKEEIASYNNLDLQAVARKFLLESEGRPKVIFGIKRPEHLERIYADLQLPDLTNDLKKSIADLYESDFGLKDEQHLRY